MPPVWSMPLPVCLIENEGSNLVVNKEAVDILQQISDPAIVVAIVGKYRTGKSFLMNRLAGCNGGFPLGSSIQSKTKGIWMWCVPHPRNPGHVLVLLDTEGLGDVEKGDSKNDAWIFSLTVLLSSALVYNSMGTIDQQAIEQLHYVTQLTEIVKTKSSNSRDGSAAEKELLPSFTWCVRDFSLILERDGKEITEDEYLMMGLELKSGENIENYNLPRECIRKFFRSHKCFVFDRPTSKKNLQRLDELKESELEQEFVEQAAKFYDHIMKSCSVKLLSGGIPVTGKLLGKLASMYVDTIQSGSVPCMENAVLALSEIENNGALQDALSTYESEMEKHAPKLPTLNEGEFLKMHMKSSMKADQVFMKRSLNNKWKYRLELKNQISEKRHKFMKRNEDKSIEVSTNLLKNLSLTMQNGLMQGRYTQPGGHKLFLVDKEIFLERYHRMPGKGVKSLDVLLRFMHENKNIEEAIQQAEEKMGQAEKRLAESHQQTMLALRQKESVERRYRDLQKSVDQQRTNHKQVINSLTNMAEQNKSRMIRENQTLITQRLQAQQSTLSSTHQQALDDLQRTIEELRRNSQTQSSGGGGCILS
ncbi:guanylate-binding protein 6-like [Dendrobates tinctorius]|uniref:guanylate-binding protein 6-like n=1 Tax=Dendrobates tinctorius TaxID=92724 RepID=UPI003CCA4B93